jgi:hypothetical protein
VDELLLDYVNVVAGEGSYLCWCCDSREERGKALTHVLTAETCRIIG